MRSIVNVKIMGISLLLFIALVTGSFGQESRELVLQANRAFLSGKEEVSKALYLKAAAMGSRDAHYWLSARFPLTREEKIYHYSEAAKRGHAEALTSALDIILFRANSLTETDPQRAFELYNEVKKANPGLNAGYYGEQGAEIIKMCAEPKGFDPAQFMKRYGVEEKEAQPYYIWELAEEASTGGRFGKPDPELVFNLVMRGGFAPFELMSAVDETYRNWKKGVVKKFDICEHVTSGYGQNYCAVRQIDGDEEKENAKLAELMTRMGRKSGKLLDKAYDSAAKFFEAKAENEEGYRCGTAHVAMVLASQKEHMDWYLALIEQVRKKRFKPSPGESPEIADEKLNKTYQNVLDRLKKSEDSPLPCEPSRQEMKTVQRLWITYRDTTARLFTSIYPSVAQETWKRWLTEKRRKELESALKW